jgi:hypothetical protein
VIFEELKKKLIVLRDSMPEAILTLLQYESDVIVGMNVGQLRQGKRKDNSLITPKLRSRKYSKEKKSKGGGAPFGTPDLIDRGDFAKSYYTKKTKDTLIIDATDEKTPKLVKKYSTKKANIMGLDTENMKELRNIIKPKLQNGTRKYIQK